MRPEPIVAMPPFFNDRPCLAQGREPFQVQAFVSQFAVEAFNVRVLNWFSRFDKEQLDPILIGPSIQHMTGELRPIIRLDH